MKHLFFPFIALLSSCAMKQSPTQKLDAIFSGFEKNSPAAHALLVIKQGETVYKKTVGTADLENRIAASPQTNFRMASVSKQFTAAAILLLEKQGKLSLQQTLADFFPGFSPSGKLITLRHLLTHTSGIVDYEEIMPDTLKTQLLDADVLDMVWGYDKTYFPAGSGFRYSNTGFCLLALVVERVSGQTFADFIEKQIFGPLGMEHSRVFEPGEDIPDRAFGYAPDESGSIQFSDQSLTSATKGDGGVYTSLDDFERWSRLRRERLGLDFPASFPSCETSVPEIPDAHYGLGWFFLRPQKMPLTLYHTGSTCGFSNIVVEIPEEQTLVVFFTNLAGHHQAFKPVLEVLEEAGVLHPETDLWELHERTR